MYLGLYLIIYHSVEYLVEYPHQRRILQNVPGAVLDLTTAVRSVVLNVLMANVITLTGPVLVDVNQDTTLERVSYVIQVSKMV